MDNLSDSLRGELDSVTSSESLQLITDEFRLKHAFTPDVSNVELSKRIALLELENERLRIDLENTRIDSDARIAANQGLKGKITELYVEVQSVMQDKQKLQNSLMEINSRLTAAETSTNWYKSQLHNSQADRKSLQVEIDTYQRILRQRQQAIVDLTARYKQLNADYTELMQKHQREKQELQEEIRTLKLQSFCPDVEEEVALSPHPDLSTKLETIEDELRGTKNELKSLEQRLLSSEAAKLSLENVLSKQRALISNMEETIQRDAAERNESTSMLHKAQFDVQRLTSENKCLQTSLLSSQQEQRQIEDVINQLRSQLTKMLAQYKLLKSRNAELDEKLVSMQNLVDENKRLKTLAHKANASLIEKLRQEKRKNKFLERRIYKEKEQFIGNVKSKMEPSLIVCLKQALARNKDLNERLKSLTKSSDESIDEGYGDSSVISSISNYSAVDVPSPPPLNPLLLHSVNSILSNNRTFLTPVQTKLDELKLKMETLRDRCTVVMNKHNNVFHESTKIVSPVT